MALETVVFQQDPFSYGSHSKDVYEIGLGGENLSYSYGFEQDKACTNKVRTVKELYDTNNYYSSPEACGGDGFFAGRFPQVEEAAMSTCRLKRRRTRSFKNKEDVENQRMTHITVERNRRKQMNDYLSLLRSLMPASYLQRGDQASIVGGAINFVKELEQLLQSLEAQKQKKLQQPNKGVVSSIFSDFFTFPQYLTRPTRYTNSPVMADPPAAGNRFAIADVEVTMVETHSNLKILIKKQPKQLLKMVVGLHSLHLTILHLNITTVDHLVLYSISVKVEEDCQLLTVNDLATAVYEMVGMIQREANLVETLVSMQ